MTNVMVDIETLGNGPDAAVLSIGAVEFSASGTGPEFYNAVKLHSAMKYGTVNAATIKWWMEQEAAARAVFKEGKQPLIEVLLQFKLWLEDRPDGAGEVLLWGNGVAFDNVILRHAYNSLNLEVPWKWYNDRCYRTVKNLYPHVKINRAGTYHNALDDARNQACHLINIASTGGFSL